MRFDIRDVLFADAVEEESQVQRESKADEHGKSVEVVDSSKNPPDYHRQAVDIMGGFQAGKLTRIGAQKPAYGMYNCDAMGDNWKKRNQEISVQAEDCSYLTGHPLLAGVTLPIPPDRLWIHGTWNAASLSHCPASLTLQPVVTSTRVPKDFLTYIWYASHFEGPCWISSHMMHRRFLLLVLVSIAGAGVFTGRGFSPSIVNDSVRPTWRYPDANVSKQRDGCSSQGL